MAYKIKIEKFEGPLDLLLQLIEQEQLDISEVSLAKVTEQYLEYLDESSELPAEELADFLVVAAKLLLIKSRILLPQLNFEEEEEEIDLKKQLKIYKEFYEISKVLDKMILKKRFLFSRERPVVKIDNVFNPPKGITASKLKVLFEGVLKDLEAWVIVPREVMVKTISIRERIINLHRLIKEKTRISFRQLLKDTKNKTEIIVTFLAVLELVKQRTVAVVQRDIFDDIEVKKISEEDIDYKFN